MLRNYLLGALFFVGMLAAPCQANVFNPPSGGVVQPPNQTVKPSVPMPQSQGTYTPQRGIQPGPAQPGQDQPAGSSTYNFQETPQLQQTPQLGR